MDDFYVILPSNAKTTGVNTPSHFLTTFDESIHIEDLNQWKVGLYELNFKNTIQTIHKDSIEEHSNVVNELPQKKANPMGNDTKIIEIDKKEWYCTESKMYIIGVPKDEDYTPPGLPGLACRWALIYHPVTNTANLVNETEFEIDVYMPLALAKYYELDKLGDEVYQKPDMISYRLLPRGGEGSIIKSPLSKPFKVVDKKMYFPFAQVNENEKEPNHRVGAYLHPIYINTILHTGTITPGAYNSIDELIKEVNERMLNFSIVYNSRKNRAEIKPKSNDKTINLHLKNGLNDVLGFSNNTFNAAKGVYQAELDVNLLRGINNIFVYCNICEPIKIGNTQAPLIRTIAFNNEKYGKTFTFHYINPMYVNINKKFIDSIEIMLCDATGDTLPLAEGLTTCTLHFKRV